MATAGTYAVLDNENLIPLFDKHYEAALGANFSANIGMALGSDSETETYGWLGAAPSLDELKSEAITEEGLKQFTYSLRNKEYAKALKFKEKDMRRDKIGQIENRIGEFAEKAAEHWDSLVATLITDNGTAYDGASFFSTAHAESGSSQVNALTSSHVSGLNVATATAPTASEVAGFLPEVIAKFHLLTDDKGDPINGNARSFKIMCGTAPIWSAFLAALGVQNLTSGATNQVMSVKAIGYTFDLVLTPRLSSVTDKFYIFRTDSRVKPFILQEEVPITPEILGRESDEYKKFRRFVYSIYTSRAAGYGRWQSAMSATLS